MLDESAIEMLRLALAGLGTPDSTAAWAAIEPLNRLPGHGLDVVIDLAATSALGATVLVSARPAGAQLLARLTPRRREVAGLMIGGASNKAIARALGLSVGTVKDHVHAILTTLGFASRAELISAALGRS